jgi:hypothetical protein
MPSTFVDTCEQVYNVSTTNYNAPCGPIPYIDSDRGILQGDIIAPFLFTIFFEHFLRSVTVGSRGYHPSAPTTNADPNEPTVTNPDHGFANDLSLATDFPTNMSIQPYKLPLFNKYTGVAVKGHKCCITCAL